MVIMDMNFGHGIGLWSSYGLYYGLLSDWLPWSSYGRELSGLMYVSKKHQWKHKVNNVSTSSSNHVIFRRKRVNKEKSIKKKKKSSIVCKLIRTWPPQQLAIAYLYMYKQNTNYPSKHVPPKLLYKAHCLVQ